MRLWLAKGSYPCHFMKTLLYCPQHFMKIALHGISSQIFGLVSSFLSNRWLQVVLDGRSSQEYPGNAGIPPFLVLQFSYCTLMTFLTMLSVILLSMVMILFSILSVIRHLICDNNLNWLLNLSLIYETLWTGLRSGLLIWITMVILMWKWMCLFLGKIIY